jgi:putative membrane protein
MRWNSSSWPFLLGIYAALTVITVAYLALGQSFQLWLVILYPLVGFGFCLVHAVDRLGLQRALLFLGLTLVVSLLFETLGVATGWIYGGYYYVENRLGPLFLGLVPYMIPLTWFMMLYLSYVVAERCTPFRWGGRRRGLIVAALGGLAMAAWDLALDPLMVAHGHWVWEKQGAYFGVPLQNYLGWCLTAFVILALYQGIGEERARHEEPGMILFDRLAVLIYLITGLGTASEAWLNGLSGPALAGGSAVLVWFLLGWGRATDYAALVISSRKL